MADMTDVAVRDLTSFVFRCGDLYPTGEGRSVEAWEGTIAHAAMQKQRTAADTGYRKEVSLKLPVKLLGEQRQLQGRVDGVSRNSHGQTVIEEYKTSRRAQPLLRGPDQAQAWLYAGMLCAIDSNIEVLVTRVIYISPQGEELACFETSLNTYKAQLFLSFALACYSAHLQRQHYRSLLRLQWAKTLEFPYPRFRKHQRAMAGQVFNSLSKGENLLLEAVTGSGKTLAVLFPAIKAQAMDEQFFFLTSRGRGADTALTTLKQLIAHSAPLRVVHITAKEKICPRPQLTCDASLCPNAADYYSRLPQALNELALVPLADRTVIEEKAAEHSLCPFELSLDHGLNADLIIGDYNYIFDPSARLQRFQQGRQQALLIDEAHQLSARISDMLSVDLTLTDVVRAKSQAPEALQPILAALTEEVVRTAASAGADGRSSQQELENPQSLAQTLGTLLAACDDMLGKPTETAAEHARTRLRSGAPQTATLFPVIMDQDGPTAETNQRGRADDARHLLPEDLLKLYFIALRWQRSEQWTAAENYRYIVSISDYRHAGESLAVQGDVSISKRCIDSSYYAAQVMAEHRAVVRFSGTLSPLDMYQRMHGQPALSQSEHNSQSVALRARSPFRPEQLHILAITDINTLYRQRGQSLTKLCQLLATLQRAQPGRYLIAMPSYEYLDQLAACPALPDYFMSQSRQMDDAAQRALLASFSAMEQGVLGIVMGGVFGESVDLGASPLAGVIVVSLALPPADLSRSLTSKHFEQQHGQGLGQQVAYLQPALSRIVQAAGRVIRGPNDKGVVCLVDPRFLDPNLAGFFPEHWQLRPTHTNGVEKSLKAFWSNDLSAAAD